MFSVIGKDRPLTKIYMEGSVSKLLDFLKRMGLENVAQGSEEEHNRSEKVAVDQADSHLEESNLISALILKPGLLSGQKNRDNENTNKTKKVGGQRTRKRSLNRSNDPSSK